MFAGIIEKKVMAVIKEKITATQEKYDAGVKVLEENLEKDKVALEETLVGEILAKLI